MVWQTFASLAAGNQPLSLFDTLAQQIAQCVVIPCTATGTNNISLTANANGPPVTVYNNYALFSFVAANTSTGSCQLQVASIGLLNLYTPGGTVQASTGSIVAGSYYVVAYQSQLNTGAGGFVIVSSTAASLTLPVSVANGGTGDTSLTAYAVLCGGTTSTNPVQPIASVGTATQVLTSNGPGALPTFQAASSGSFTLLTTLTASNSANLSDTTHITSSYNWYMFQFENIVPVTNIVSFRMQVSENGGVSYISTNYAGGCMAQPISSTHTFVEPDTSTSALLMTGTNVNSDALGNFANSGFCGIAYLINPNSSAYKMFYGNAVFNTTNGLGNFELAFFGGSYQGDTNVINAVQFTMSSGNISTGKIRIFGASL
jgi:hypothetical protein